MQHNRLITFVLAFLMFVVWCAPLTASAEVPTGPINYMDLDYSVKEGAAYNQVTVPIPEENLYLGIYNQSTTTNVAALRGSPSITYTVDPGIGYTLRVYPFSTYGLLLDNIPEGTILNFTLKVEVEGTENFYVPSLYKDYYYNDVSGNRVQNLITSQIDGTVGEVVHISYELKLFPDGANSFVPLFRYVNFGTALDGSAKYKFTVSDVALVMNISNGYWEQWLAEQNGQMIDDATDKITGSIQDSTDQIQDSILGVGDQISQDIAGATDQIMSGGQAGVELENDTGKLDQSADDLTNGVGEINKFEDDLFADVENNLDEIISGANINGIATPLLFVQNYVEKIFGAIPSNYRVVFTLPIFFGIFLYIVGHPVRAPRPDTSGDYVTRETFTTTEVLSGPNKGQSSTLRTVSESRITNRSSPE